MDDTVCCSSYFGEMLRVHPLQSRDYQNCCPRSHYSKRDNKMCVCNSNYFKGIAA